MYMYIKNCKTKLTLFCNKFLISKITQYLAIEWHYDKKMIDVRRRAAYCNNFYNI